MVKTYDSLHCICEFKISAIKANKDALRVLVHNVRSLSKHVNDIVSDRRM